MLLYWCSGSDPGLSPIPSFTHTWDKFGTRAFVAAVKTISHKMLIYLVSLPVWAVSASTWRAAASPSLTKSSPHPTLCRRANILKKNHILNANERFGPNGQTLADRLQVGGAHGGAAAGVRQVSGWVGVVGGCGERQALSRSEL